MGQKEEEKETKYRAQKKKTSYHGEQLEWSVKQSL